MAIAVAYERRLAGPAPAGEAESDDKAPTKVARAVVFGDSDWITNKYFQYSSHKDLVLNTMNWAAGEEAAITIRPKKMRSSLTPIRGDTFRTLLLSGFVVPEFILIAGLLIWWRRTRWRSGQRTR